MTIQEQGKIHCPVCGALSKSVGFGRDGSPRSLGYRTQKSDNPKHVLRRLQAYKIRRQNATIL